MYDVEEWRDMDRFLVGTCRVISVIKPKLEERLSSWAYIRVWNASTARRDYSSYCARQSWLSKLTVDTFHECSVVRGGIPPGTNISLRLGFSSASFLFFLHPHKHERWRALKSPSIGSVQASLHLETCDASVVNRQPSHNFWFYSFPSPLLAFDFANIHKRWESSQCRGRTRTSGLTPSKGSVEWFFLQPISFGDTFCSLNSLLYAGTRGRNVFGRDWWQVLRVVV